MKSWLAIIWIMIIGCEPTWEYEYELFTIPKGEHYSTYQVELLQAEHLQFEAMFDETVYYQTKTEENQYDINKLFGFSDCNSHHHDNSARFGWRYVADSIEIFVYSYVSGERLSEPIGKTIPNHADYYQISLTTNHYIYQFNDKVIEVPRTKPCDQGVYYLLFPYFGGNETAPHDIHVYIKRQF